MNRIKVLLATYNGLNYIAEQINSILSQEGVDVNLYVNDDGSKDNTVEIIRRDFPSIPVAVNNPGTGSAANNFLKMLSEVDFSDDFDFISFSDQDDIWLPSKLKAAADKLYAETADLYCSNLTKWDMADGSLSELKKDFPQKKFDYLFEGGSAGCTYVFTKQFGGKLKNFCEKVDSKNWKEFSHDWLIYFFARSRNYKVVIDGNSYIKYRIHDSNVHGHLNKISLSAIKHRFSAFFDDYYKNHVVNYVKFVKSGSTDERIYKAFLGTYFSRNYMIWKYNFNLMRNRKKFLIFAFMNLLKFN